MKKQILSAVAVGVFAIGLAGSVAWAATTTAMDVSFSFFVNGKELPAGHYEIETVGTSESTLRISDAKSHRTVLVKVIERLANTGAKEPRVVFDKMEDGKSYLSEIHVPGADGFLVGLAKGRETHVTVTGKQ